MNTPQSPTEIIREQIHTIVTSPKFVHSLATAMAGVLQIPVENPSTLPSIHPSAITPDDVVVRGIPLLTGRGNEHCVVILTAVAVQDHPVVQVRSWVGAPDKIPGHPTPETPPPPILKYKAYSLQPTEIMDRDEFRMELERQLKEAPLGNYFATLLMIAASQEP